jgi:hypothetical protein
VLLILLDDLSMCCKDVLFQRQICCTMRGRRLDTQILVPEIEIGTRYMTSNDGTLYMTSNDDDARDQNEDMNMSDMGDTLFCFAL